MITPIPLTDIDRERPLEALAGCASVDDVRRHLVAAVDPTFVEDVERLFGVLAGHLASAAWPKAEKAADDIRLVTPTDDLRATVTLALAIGAAPGAAAQVSRDYAVLAITLTRWIARHGWEMTSPAQQAVLARLRLRARAAQSLSIGWAGIAENVGSGDEEAHGPLPSQAGWIATEVAAATAERRSLTDAEIADDQSWRDRLSGLYGHLGGQSGSLYFECLGGWRHLLEDLLRDIDATLTEEDREHFQVTQVKEKFGTLRFYTSYMIDPVERLIEVAHDRSAFTCEVCGEPGRVQGKGYISCKCPAHDDDARRREREARR